MRSQRLLRFALVLLPATAAAQNGAVEPTAFERTGTFANPKIDESSGVAVSRRLPSVLWTHNDSGDRPFLYATNLQGGDLGTFSVTGAEAHDWEDIAIGPCPAAPARSCLYIADTGDNLEVRPGVHIYIVPEPEVRTRPEPRAAPTRGVQRITVRYPDGAHDVEALAVAPDGEISLITKGRSGPVVRFVIPAPTPRTQSVVAQLVDTLRHQVRSSATQATGAAFSPDGRVLALRTYTEILFYERLADKRLRPIGPVCWIGMRQPGGEAIDFLDADTLVLTSEAVFGRPGVIDRVRCPIDRGGSR